jgi:hypothetical protein
MPRAAQTRLPQPVFNEPTFSEGKVTPDPNGFQVAHPSDDETYKKIENLLTKDTVAIPPSRSDDNELYGLDDAYGPNGAAVLSQIKKAGKIIFHSCGDSGASAVRKYANELRVADQLSIDCARSNADNRPAFLYHLGDIVYDFGESQYYYDQFYEPFRAYPAPIFAIPGNHDSFVLPGTKKGSEPLTIFQRNFCATSPTITQEAGSLHRTAMTQPGVYFALDAPFVRIIGLFSNALEDPGVISNQSKNWPGLSKVQLSFLTAQLKLIKQQKYQGAVLLAVHHPPFSYAPPKGSSGAGGYHGCSSAMLGEIDSICQEIGVYPHAFLSGHAHNYQRYSRIVQFAGKEYDVPFIVCGDGGHNVNPLVQAKKGSPAHEPQNGANVEYLESKPVLKVQQLILEKYDDTNYGYLRIHVDKEQLRIGFHEVGVRTLAQSRYDLVTVNLADHTMVAN